MAEKKKGLKIGGVNFDFHFNNPDLQKAYENWFLKTPLRAPVQVEYYDPTTVGGVIGGTVKRTPTTTRMDPYEQARGQMMEKYKYGYNSGSDAVFKQHPIVKRPISSGSSGKVNKALRASVGKSGASLKEGIDRTNERLKALGKEPVKQSSHGGIFNRVLDYLSRGNYAVAEAVNSATRDANKNDASVGSQLGAFGSGFWQGLSGKKKTTFSGLLAKKGVGRNITTFLDKHGSPFVGHTMNKVIGQGLQGTAGLGLDIGLDPTTYAGVGLVGKGGKAYKLSEKAAEHLDEGAKLIRGRNVARKISTFDDATRELLAGKRYVRGQIKHSEEALIYKPLTSMRNSIKNTRRIEIADELRSAKVAQMGNVTAKDAAAISKQAAEAAAKEADDWFATAVKNYQDTVNAQLSKGLGVGIAGPNGKKVTLVPAPIIDFARARVQNIDVVDRGIKAADKYLRASAGVAPELHNLRLQATNAGMTRAEVLGNRLRSAFAGTHRDMREMSWTDALNRKVSGETINVGGKTVDAGEFLSNEIDTLEHAITGTTTGDVPMSASELRNFLPPGFRGKLVNTKQGIADIRKSMQSWDLKDGPRALFVGQQAYERARAVRSMYVSAADAFGIRTTGQGALKNATSIFQDLERRGWREVNAKKTHGLLKGVVFDEETARGIEKIVDLIGNERNWNTFLRKLARITSPIKFALTVPNPGYHIRNSIGDAFINELDNVGLKSYAQSAQVLRHAGEKYGGTTPLIMTEGNILENAFKSPSQVVLFHTKAPLRKPGGVRSTAVTEAEIYAGMQKFGITQNFTLSEFSNLSDNPNVVSQFGGKVKSWMVNKSETRENYFRLAHFIDLVKKNPTGARTLEENMASAAARIRKTHFDYTDFTKFEKQVASNVIPFYKWTRKAVPLMLEIMFTNPGKAIIPNKAQQALSYMMGQDPRADDPFPNIKGMIPDWMIQAGYSPAAALAGTPTMFGVSSPFTDTWTQTLQPAAQAIGSGSPKRMFNFIAQQSNPALKVPYELLENKNTFLSNKQDVPIWHADTKKKDILNYLINQIPYARQVNRASMGPQDRRNFGALISQLTGIYAQQLTPSMLRGELYRQNNEAYARLKKAKDEISAKLKEQGVPPPRTQSEWEALFEALSKRSGGNYQRPSRARTKSVL